MRRVQVLVPPGELVHGSQAAAVPVDALTLVEQPCRVCGLPDQISMATSRIDDSSTLLRKSRARTGV